MPNITRFVRVATYQYAVDGDLKFVTELPRKAFSKTRRRVSLSEILNLYGN